MQLAEAGIISTCLQGFLYGFSILMFVLTGWILLRNRRRRQTNRGVLAAGLALFLLSTAIFSTNIARLREGLITIGPHQPQGIEEYFKDVSQTTFVIKSTLYNVQTLVLDAVVIYRAYIVWQRWYVVVVPGLSWCGLLAVTIGNNLTLATPVATSGNVFAGVYGRWISAVYSTTLATNLSATGLLAYRIWDVSRRSSDYAMSDNLDLIFRVVIESGAIYSVAIVVALICYLADSNGVYVMLDLLCPIANIVFNMIIVRVGLATESQLSQAASGPTSGLEFSSSQEAASRRRTYRSARDGGGQTRSLAVELTHYLEMDGQDHDHEASSVADRDSKGHADLEAMTSEDRDIRKHRPSDPD